MEWNSLIKKIEEIYNNSLYLIRAIKKYDTFYNCVILYTLLVENSILLLKYLTKIFHKIINDRNFKSHLFRNNQNLILKWSIVRYVYSFLKCSIKIFSFQNIYRLIDIVITQWNEMQVTTKSIIYTDWFWASYLRCQLKY